MEQLQARANSPPLRILMLLTDAYGPLGAWHAGGGYGGIAKFNQDFLKGLDAHRLVERVHAIPRIGSPLADERLPESIVYDRTAVNSKFKFLGSIWNHTWRTDRVNLVVCGHLHLLSAAWLFARTHRVRLALIVHGIEAWKPTRHRIANHMVPKVDSIISVSRLSADRVASWSGLEKDRVFVLPNCVDLARFIPGQPDPSLAKRYGLQSSSVIMTVGRFESEGLSKGFDEVIMAMPRLLARVPRLKYVIVGEGPGRARLETLAKAAGVFEHVVFTGRVPESKKVAHYQLADAYVMPSMGEGFGITLIEAAACGLPVIGSSLDGSQEALLGGRLGRLVDPRDSQALFQAIIEVLASPVRERNPLIAEFSEQRFQERLGHWLEEQSHAIASRGRRAHGSLSFRHLASGRKGL